MGSYGSQSGDRIAAANAYDAMVRRQRQAEPKLLVALPESVVKELAEINRPKPMTLDRKHDLVLACQEAIGGFRVQ